MLLSPDWLIQPPAVHASVAATADGKTLTLQNGLVRRTFRLSPDAATVGLDQLVTGEAFLRAVGPEAVVTIDGKQRAVGGLTGQPNHAFLKPEWLPQLKADPDALHFTGYSVGKPVPRFAAAPALAGVSLDLKFAAPGLAVTVHYELYDGLPVFAKWLTVSNSGEKPFRVSSFTSERLALVEPESVVDKIERWEQPNISVSTDYSFGGMGQSNSNKTVHFVPDPGYATQVNYERQTPCLLEVRPPYGPDIVLEPGQSLDSFWTFVLLHDSTERERKGLALRKMYRALAPWVLDNPLLLHVTSTNPETVKTAIDQCAEVGFEMVILSFGSGLNMEDTSPQNIAKFKALADYAHSKKIRLGGYSLLASRSISERDDVKNPNGAIFGNSPCLGSKWGIAYFEHLKTFLTETGFDILEHDGSYPGDICASTTHPGHQGLADSQWTQFMQIRAFYHWCRSKNIYLNVPDFYFLNGSNKTGMGYRESNWSLPRAEQVLHARQNLFDGTWEKTPSMGWMFVPLVQYQGGGAAATIEPLKDHLPDYERHLQNNLGYGAQACYRGPRLYDTPETKALVTKWVAWFKAHRAILESDLLHLRRADGRDWDGVLHVNPALKEKALAVLFNPTDQPITRALRLPLYYTGLTKSAKLAVGGGKAKTYTLERDYSVTVQVTIPAGGMEWLVVE
ncbi:alpha-galactosidase [Armatimonas rosea]|uniref:Alpha-galactosidase n=1 Tax=Armatimonas rosea TaxID=685828 RepID=A0A7W9STB0_ARMRO|nr:alpha-galactosidase [Armatimonas rosea]MBB6051923.1 hypothetical protein [Armatimonas rosea]